MSCNMEAESTMEWVAQSCNYEGGIEAQFNGTGSHIGKQYGGWNYNAHAIVSDKEAGVARNVGCW